MKWLDRLREQEIVRASPLAVQIHYGLGRQVEPRNRPGRWRVTRHAYVPTIPSTTVIVYGVRVNDSSLSSLAAEAR